MCTEGLVGLKGPTGVLRCPEMLAKVGAVKSQKKKQYHLSPVDS